MVVRIFLMLILTYAHPVIADWVEINGLDRSEQWKLPPQSAGKNKFLWQRYTIKQGVEELQITEIRKYDCYGLKYNVIQAQGITNTGEKISLPLSSTWYRIKRDSDYHRLLIANGVCPN